MANDVINALKRLESAGAEDSRTARKLRAAARSLSDHIIAQLSDDVIREIRLRWEPGYKYANCERELPGDYALAADDQGNLVLAEFRPDEGWFPVDNDREAALRLSELVAAGWLDEIAEWLERRSADSESATTALEVARATSERK